MKMIILLLVMVIITFVSCYTITNKNGTLKYAEISFLGEGISAPGEFGHPVIVVKTLKVVDTSILKEFSRYKFWDTCPNYQFIRNIRIKLFYTSSHCDSIDAFIKLKYKLTGFDYVTDKGLTIRKFPDKVLQYFLKYEDSLPKHFYWY